MKAGTITRFAHRITFLGGADEVGTSGILVETAGQRVAVTVSFQSSTHADAADYQAQFNAISGWELSISVIEQPVAVDPLPAKSAGQRMEINAAYCYNKSVLAGNSLYRTRLKGGEIALMFIPPQVGERYQSQIAGLATQTGWAPNINPEPNQGATLETAHTVLSSAGLEVTKCPGIYPEKPEVTATVSTVVESGVLAEISAAFEEQTGCRMTISAQTARAEPSPRAAPQDFVEIPLERIPAVVE